MPLFKCSNCGALENTALGYYWPTALPNNSRNPECSECHSGKWHGKFEKIQADENDEPKGFDRFYVRKS